MRDPHNDFSGKVVMMGMVPLRRILFLWFTWVVSILIITNRTAELSKGGPRIRGVPTQCRIVRA